jgi:hypothetical protein
VKTANRMPSSARPANAHDGPRREAGGPVSVLCWNGQKLRYADDQPTPSRLGHQLGVQERVFLFCLGSGTDWTQAGVTLKTVAGLVLNLLVMPTRDGRLALTVHGRAALRELLRDL